VLVLWTITWRHLDGTVASALVGLKLSLKLGLSGKVKSPNAFAATAHALYHLAYA